MGGFHFAHRRRIARAVAPVWAAQVVLSLWCIERVPGSRFAWLQLLFAAAAVVTTLIGAIPIHRRLERHYDDHDVQLLRHWHLWRTAAWVACALATVMAL